jgi:glycosyltransferase involved in cell wall biosynthesis
MKASFVIPVKDGSSFIAETLKSCVEQKLKDIEIIVVDDGSTDRTVDIVRGFAEKDKRIVLIQHEKNLGRSIARNTGIASAKSDIILTQDADDIAHPMRALETVKYFKLHPGVDIVSTKAQMIDLDGVVLGVLDTQPFSFENVKKELFTRIVHSSMAFRKNVFEKVKYTDGDYSKHAIDDWKFQIDAHKAGFKFGYLTKKLVYYRHIAKERDENKIMGLKKSCLN